jgi:hypothetical protein
MSTTPVHPRVRLSARDCGLAAFRAPTERATGLAGCPHATSVVRNVLVYDSDRVLAADRRAVQEELVRALTDGPGVVVLRGAFPDPAVVDREAVAAAVYPVLLGRGAEGVDARWLDNVIAASAEDCPFPTNLDRDPPVDGLAPPSRADLVRRALREEWAPRALRDALRAGRRTAVDGPARPS